MGEGPRRRQPYLVSVSFVALGGRMSAWVLENEAETPRRSTPWKPLRATFLSSGWNSATQPKSCGTVPGSGAAGSDKFSDPRVFSVKCWAALVSPLQHGQALSVPPVPSHASPVKCTGPQKRELRRPQSALTDWQLTSWISGGPSSVGRGKVLSAHRDMPSSPQPRACPTCGTGRPWCRLPS